MRSISRPSATSLVLVAGVPDHARTEAFVDFLATAFADVGQVAIAGWNIEASEGSPDLPTHLELKLPDGVRAIGDWDLPQAMPMLDAADQLVWEGDVVFRRRVEGPPAKLAQPITVTVDYQTCDANLCEPPAEIDVSVRRASSR